MVERILQSEEAGAVAVIALSAAIAALVANGPGRVSLGRMVSGALSNPVPRPAPSLSRPVAEPVRRAA